MHHRSPVAPRALFLLATSLLPLTATAQSSLPIEQFRFDRIEHPWPNVAPFDVGIDSDLTIGRFVPGHPGVCAVVLRNGRPKICFQPADTRHFAAAGSQVMRRIATVPAVNGRPDLLAALQDDGLCLYLLGATFVPTIAPNNPNASWQAAQELSVERFGTGSGAATWFLGHSAASARLGTLNASGGVTTQLVLPMPAGVQLFWAAMVQWLTDDAPELALLTSSGLSIVTATGTVVQSFASTPTAGRVAAWRAGPEPAVVQLAHVNGAWEIATAFANRFVVGGALDLPRGLKGMAVAPLDHDAFPDLLVSSCDSIRRIAMSNADGPRTAYGDYVELWDVNPANWPSAPWQVDNLPDAVIADLDDDGRLDLATTQRPTNQLVITKDLAGQLAEHVFHEQLVTLDVDVHFHSCQGLDSSTFEGTTVGPAFPHAAVPPALFDVLGLRIDAPIDSAGRTLLVSRYGINAAGPEEAASDPYEPVPTNYTFAIGHVANAEVLDFVVPLPRTTGVARHLVEIRVVDATPDGFFNSSKPLFLQVVTTPVVYETSPTIETPSIFALVTEDHENGWVFDGADLSDYAFFSVPPASGQLYAPSTSGGGGPPYAPGNRFIGGLDIPNPKDVKKNATTAVPSSSPPVPLGSVKAQ